MRKFTKEISVLLAAVTAGSAGVCSMNAETDDMTGTAGVAAETTTVTTEPIAGAMMLRPDSTEETEELPEYEGVAMNTDSTEETEELPEYEGVAMNTDDTEETDLPPLAGEPLPPDDYITDAPAVTAPVTEEIPAFPGMMLPPDDSECGECVAGDINADGKADLTDMTELSLFLIGDKALEDEQYAASDLDGDGSVTRADLAKFRQFLSKVIDSLS